MFCPILIKFGNAASAGVIPRWRRFCPNLNIFFVDNFEVIFRFEIQIRPIFSRMLSDFDQIWQHRCSDHRQMSLFEQISDILLPFSGQFSIFNPFLVQFKFILNKFGNAAVVAIARCRCLSRFGQFRMIWRLFLGHFSIFVDFCPILMKFGNAAAVAIARWRFQGF